MLIQNFGGQIRCAMGNVEVADWPFRDCEETGLMRCRIALWDCFGTLSLFSTVVTKLRRKLGQNSFLNNVTAAMLVYKNNETTAMNL